LYQNNFSLIASALLDAEVRLGELLAAMETTQGKNRPDRKGFTGETFSKHAKIRDDGIHFNSHGLRQISGDLLLIKSAEL
jgi:hypothetical protein